jgi:resuscitation-promoting factor RpfB
MKRNTALSRTYTNEFDINGTLTAQSLAKAHRDPLRRVGRGVLVAIGISLLLVPSAGGSKPVQYVSYKEYALHSLGYNYKEFKCLEILYTNESNWRPLARNGSHHGIPQGRSEYLSRVDGYKQIQWGLKYIGHRYGEPCIALAHWKAKGWH